MMNLIKLLACTLLLVSTTTNAQNYDYDDGYNNNDNQDYGQDNLYHDYAMKQQDKQVAAPGFGWTKIMVGTGLGWFMGGAFHSRRKEKTLNAKFKEEQKALYTQYYNDVYALQQQNAELVDALEQMGVRLR